MSVFYRYPFVNPTRLARNLMTNPSFEVDLTGWAPAVAAPTLTRLARSGGPTELAGSWAMRVTATAASSTEAQSPAAVGFPATVYTATGSMRGTALPVALTLRFYNASDVMIGSATIGAYTTASSSWQTVHVTATSPALTAYVRVGVRTQSPAIGNFTDWDTISLMETNAVLPYFDGDTPSLLSTVYSWLGTPQLSSSIAEGPGSVDTITPDLGILTPYRVTYRARSVVHELLEGGPPRTVMRPGGARSGTIEAVFTEPADAMYAVQRFSEEAIFLVIDEDYTIMWFAVTGGDPEFEQRDAVTVISVPFVEVGAP